MYSSLSFLYQTEFTKFLSWVRVTLLNIKTHLVLSCGVLGAQSLSPVWLFATPQTVACQAPLSVGFSRQDYWSGLPFHTPRSSRPRNQSHVSCIFWTGRLMLDHSAIWEAPLSRDHNSKNAKYAPTMFKIYLVKSCLNYQWKKLKARKVTF